MILTLTLIGGEVLDMESKVESNKAANELRFASFASTVKRAEFQIEELRKECTVAVSARAMAETRLEVRVRVRVRVRSMSETRLEVRVRVRVRSMSETRLEVMERQSFTV